MLVPVLLLISGFALLIKSADWLVNGASALARKHNISDIVIGLTIVAFGTSSPELVVNVIASFNDHPDIVYGNIIGSNNFNLFLILGIAGLIIPLHVQTGTVWKEIPLSLIAVLTVFILSNSFFCQNNILSRLDGLLLLVMFVFFLFYIYRQMKKDVQKSDTVTKQLSNFKIWGLIIIGLAGLVLSGKLVVNNAVDIATSLGISEKIIGLTIIAAGTSLPELATSVVAAMKKNSDIAVGNIIGSNIFNILLILALSALVNPIEYNRAFNLEIYLLLCGTAFLFVAMFTGKKKKLDRWEAGILIIVFIAYIGYSVGKDYL